MKYSFADTVQHFESRITGNLHTHKKLFFKASVALCLIIILATLGELLLFEQTLRTLSPEEKGTRTVDATNITHDGFLLDQRNIFISQNENATLIISNNAEKYIENLTIKLADTPQYFLSVSFIDSKTHTEKILTKDLAKLMKKGKYTFLSSLTFPIKSNPAKITITAQNPETSIESLIVDNTPRFNFYRFVSLVAGQIILLFLFTSRKHIGSHPEWAFLAIALVCGALIAFSELRSDASWDERIHYKRADEFSFKHFSPKKVNDVYANSDAIPFDDSLTGQRSIWDHFDHDYRKIPGRSISHHKAHFKVGDVFLWYTRLCYLPIGLVLFFGRLLNLPWHLVYSLGSFAHIFTLALPIFFAIRILKTGKMILATIALLPTSVFIASNYGYDAWVTSFLALGLTILFTELQNPHKHISCRMIALMIGAFIIGLGPKAIYFPLLFLLFLLPRTKFISPKEYRLFLRTSILSILFVLCSFLLPFLTETSSFTDIRGGKQVNASEQVHFIITHPITYTKTLLSFLSDYLNPLHAGGFMTNWAYFGIIPGFLPLLFLLFFVTLTDRNEHDNKTTTTQVKFWTIGISFVTVSLVATSLYVSYTPVGLTSINGVQPRYLIPLLFPLLFVLCKNHFSIIPNRNLYNACIFSLLAAVLLNGIWDRIISLYH